MRAGEFEARRQHPASVPESPEVAEHRMDVEAVALANSGRRQPPVWREWAAHAAGVTAGLVGLYLLLLLAALLGEWSVGWPA